ncbi:membrane progestin receptor delta isoform X4 [Manis pentadactyla]|uniref:membrane progestin receptor delta isoform X4 n=1 Tax=Manis pentadactyla TaxID=143292 RepID=UPI001876D383|nr:membrane progestin receptor delta isoform X4 [Manis pentadactyla]
MLSLKLPQLLQVHQIPRVFWEDGIMSGYRRPTSSALDCVLSSFQMTNETVNIWTHFLPTWLCLPLCRLLHAGILAARPPAPALCARRRPQFLSVHRPRLLLPVGSWPVVKAKARQRDGTPRIIGRAAIVCPFPELESPGLSKILRTAAFAYPFLFDNLPLFYRLGLCWGRSHNCGQEALSTNHGYHLLCALLTGFLFASHLPERLAPGRFDYIGHSHQLFHICAVLGTHFQLEAVLADMGSRRAWLAMQEPALGLAGTVATLSLAVAGNLLIIAAFTTSLFRAPSTCPLLQGGLLEAGTKAKHQ